MNPTPDAVRRQTLLEELRLLEHEASTKRLSLSGLPIQMTTPSVQDLMRTNVNLALNNSRRGSMQGFDPMLRIDDTTLQAAMIEASRLDRGISSPSNERQSMLGVSHQNDPINVAAVARLSGFPSFATTRMNNSADSSWHKKLETAPTQVSGNKRKSEFPLPPLQERARKIQHTAAMNSFKAIWANPKVTTSTTRRELLERRLSKGSIEILGKSRSVRLASGSGSSKAAFRILS